MKYGKKICKELKAIRKEIADANGISYSPSKCNHKGECAGTCPACDAGLKYLEKELSRRQLAGKAAVVAGLSIGIASLTGCKSSAPQPIKVDKPQDEQLMGMVPMKAEKYQPCDSAATTGAKDNKAQP